jgi:hypothetical protein
MSIYLFEVVDTGYLKLGFTAGCPWIRMASGAWSNVHPKACCDKLGFENMKLLALFKGTMEQERVFQSLNPSPENGEFWPDYFLGVLLWSLARTLERLELPERPDLRNLPVVGQRREEKRVCCNGGQEFKCFNCNQVFARFHHLMQHRNSAHSTEGKTSCTKCGAKGLIRNIMCKRHTDSAKCRYSACLREARAQRVDLGPE